MNLKVLEVCPKKFCARIKKTQKAQYRNPKIERAPRVRTKKGHLTISQSLDLPFTTP